MAYNYNFNPNPTSVLPQQSNIMQQAQNVQPLFPQPQGNVYNINSTLEVANVPVGAGVSVALCLPENLMYIKTMQNGNPLFYPYKIMPFTEQSTQQKEEQREDQINPIEILSKELKDCNNRIADLENQLSKIKKKGDDWV